MGHCFFQVYQNPTSSHSYNTSSCFFIGWNSLGVWCGKDPSASFSHVLQDDNTALLFEVPQGTLIKTLAGHTRSVRSVCFDPSGRQCATASYDLTVRIHEVATGKCVSILRGHKDWITSVAWSSNGKYLATGSYGTLFDVSMSNVLQTTHASCGQPLDNSDSRLVTTIG